MFDLGPSLALKCFQIWSVVFLPLELYIVINPFMANVPILHHLKIQKKQKTKKQVFWCFILPKKLFLLSKYLHF